MLGEVVKECKMFRLVISFGGGVVGNLSLVKESSKSKERVPYAS